MVAPLPEPTWRKPVGVLLLLVYLAVYAVLVAVLFDAVGTLPTALKVIGYGAAGLAWVLPLKPLFLWMNTGRWRL